MIDFDARVNCSVSKAFGEEFLYEHKSGLSYPVTGVFWRWISPTGFR